MGVETLLAENKALREQNAILVEKLEALSLELARLKKQLIGPKSERQRPAPNIQPGLFAIPEPAPAADPPRPAAPPPTNPAPRGT